VDNLGRLGSLVETGHEVGPLRGVDSKLEVGNGRDGTGKGVANNRADALSVLISFAYIFSVHAIAVMGRGTLMAVSLPYSCALRNTHAVS
jgi:hypothetical protein